jgi:beta-mannosidase
MEKLKLIKDWEFKLLNSKSNSSKFKIDTEKWYKAKVPGTIHTDLLANQLIEDPFFADNETRIRWVAECDWVYTKEFAFDKSANDEYQLVFDGLDTIAEIYLNDNLIGSTNNMFVQYRYDVAKFWNNGKNTLKVIFLSPVKYSINEEGKHSKLQVALKSNRVYIRKAQYSFGWDWGPEFTTSGIWKDVYLIKKAKAEIENIVFNTISINEDIAEVEIKLNIEKSFKDELVLVFKLSNDTQIIEKKLSIKDKENTIRLVVPNPKLWYPNGEGEQQLYQLTLKLSNNENEIYDEQTKTVGIRIIELVDKINDEPDFLFKVNGNEVFCKGVDWIPADSFLPRVTDEKYLDLLTKAKDANMNMVRVWGGGIYENDIFYENCDKLGLLVWQDFMFACGAYPEHDSIIENIKNEVTQNVNRLQHHASIAVWCGNNENEWGWFQDQKTPVKELPGYKIYNSIIPTILKTIDSKANYWQSSPFGDDEDPNSTNSGNTHHWDIWSFWKDYTEVKNNQSLFVTEFGFQGPANIDTFNQCIPEKNRKVQDQIFEFHNKQVEGPERLFKFMSAHLPVNTNWEDFIYLTQLNQGFALKTCLEHWRTNDRTNGSLIWQLNDVWPVTSWSLIDSDSTPKMSYHFVKNIFSQQIAYFSTENNDVILSVQNQSNDKFSGSCKTLFIDTETGNVIQEIEISLNLEANSKQKIDSFSSTQYINDKTILFAELFNESGELINSNYYKTLPWKYYTLAKAEISLKLITRSGKFFIEVASDKPSYFVDLYAKGFEFSKRGFVSLPGKEIDVEVMKGDAANLQESDIKIFSLNNYLK